MNREGGVASCGAPVKGCGAGVATSDAQYMQQQSQIFVFTTQLANKAADAVMQGSFLSIIEYHCSQPATKKLLEVRAGGRRVGSRDLYMPLAIGID